MIPNISAMVHALFFALAPGLTGALAAEVNVSVADYRQLNGWQEDDHQFALWTFLKTCSDMKPEDWRSLCALAVNHYQKHQVSALVIQNWVKRNPVAGQKLMRHSPGFVFFREISNLSAHDLPLGAINRSLTALRSLAVDPKYVPFGAPVWLEKQGGTPMNCLMTAQNTGSAIKGAQWGALFLGSGDTAGRVAGGFKDAGRMFVLMPIQRAYASAMEPSR